ncbi:tafazzin [Usnea florida]
MEDDPPPPSLLWRAGSTAIMGITGSLTRAFMHSCNWQDAHGLDGFLELLDKRANIDGRQRGMITVSNHISVIDDPLIWGVLPLRYHFNPSNHRWSLGSYDIVFKNKAMSTFFVLGQVLPTHRFHKDRHGGPFQPTLREAVRLLSRPPFSPTSSALPVDHSLSSPDISDPFSSPNEHFTYTTDGIDTFPAPSAYATREYSWIHIFPEGRVHQHPQKAMRYFKWGVARLILEPDVCPDIVPMWIEGNNEIMHENRSAPRWLPRVGKRCGVWFGENVGGENDGNVFHEMRERWRRLVEEDRLREKAGQELEIGVLSEELKYGPEAVKLREECTMQVRGAVLKVRRERGLPDEDPKEGLVETWRAEGGMTEGRMNDGSLVKDA